MLANVISNLKLIGQVLTLNRDAFLSLIYNDNLELALFVVFVAGLSQAFGQSIVLFVNKVSPKRFFLSLFINAFIYIFSFLFLVFSISFTVNMAFGIRQNLRTVVAVTGFAYAPFLFSFTSLAPYLGNFINLLLSLWNLTALIIAVSIVFSLNSYQTVLSTLFAWLLVQLIRATIGRPIQGLSRAIRRFSAGKPLEFSKQKIRELITKGKTND